MGLCVSTAMIARKSYVSISNPPRALSKASFFTRISEGRLLPCDYRAAAEFNDFLKEEAAHHAFPFFAPIASGH